MPHYPDPVKLAGIHPEVLIMTARHFLEMYQNQPQLRCEETASAIEHLSLALANLDARTRDRYDRGVLGTQSP